MGFVLQNLPKPYKMNQNTIETVQALTDQLQRKLQEYSTAEASGLSRDELISLYKELKELHYQIILSKPPFKYPTYG